MTEPMVTMTGPERMRQWADYIEKNIKHHLLPLAVKNPDTLRELAAQWEADLERAANDLMLSEESFVTMRAKRDYVLSELRELRAALVQARALLKRIEWQATSSAPVYGDWLSCAFCGGDHPNHKPDCKLAAALAEGGAA